MLSNSFTVHYMNERLPQSQRILSIGDVCEITGMTKSRVRKFVRTGRLETLPRERGEQVLIPARSLDELVGYSG